jgi:hypothetical protein
MVSVVCKCLCRLCFGDRVEIPIDEGTRITAGVTAAREGSRTQYHLGGASCGENLDAQHSILERAVEKRRSREHVDALQ